MAHHARFTLVCGPDDFLVQRRARDIWSGIVSDIEDDLGQEKIDGAAANAAEVEKAVGGCISAIQTMPMFGDRKAVWLKDVSFLADSVTGRAEGTLRQVQRLQQTLASCDPGSVRVLLSASPVDRRRREYKWFQQHGEVEFIGESRRGDDVLRPLLSEEAGRLGVRLEPGATELLIAKINGNARLAVEELRKLATWLGDEGETIAESHVADLVPPFGEGDFFEAAEAFFSRNLPWTLEAIHRHFFAGYDARPLLTNLQNRNRLLIQLRVLLDAGAITIRPNKSALERAGETYLRHFGDSTDKSSLNVFSQNPWYLGRLCQSANAFPLRRLIDFQSEFLRAFTAILQRPREQEEVLRETAVRCLGGK